MVNFEYYEKQLSKNLVKSIFPKYTLKTLCVSGIVIATKNEMVGYGRVNSTSIPNQNKISGYERAKLPNIPMRNKIGGYGKANFPNIPIRNKIGGHGKANLINIPKSQNSPKYKQKISKITPKILKTKSSKQKTKSKITIIMPRLRLQSQ